MCGHSIEMVATQKDIQHAEHEVEVSRKRGTMVDMYLSGAQYWTPALAHDIHCMAFSVSVFLPACLSCGFTSLMAYRHHRQAKRQIN